MLTIEEPWGYACVDEDCVWIPVVFGPLRLILADIHKRTGKTRMIFSAVLDAEELKTHLRHIVREWDQWFAEIGDWSHCIEIEYKPPGAAPCTP